MKKRRLKWIILKYALLISGGIALFLCGAKYALSERGYHAIGGEYLLLLLPALWYFFEKNIRDTIKIKKTRNKEQRIKVAVKGSEPCVSCCQSCLLSHSTAAGAISRSRGRT